MSALFVESGPFSYTVHFSTKRRSVALQIKQGKLLIRVPFGYSLPDVEALLASKMAWISKHLQHSQQHISPDWLTLRQLPFLGDRLAITLTQGCKRSVVQCGEEIQICLSNRVSADKITDNALMLLRSWYQQQAYSWFTQRVDYWQKLMQLNAEVVMIGNWKTKWGYCKSDAELGFNWRLLMAPSWVADYVVVHELAHLRYLNHSEQFWQLVEQYFPQRRDAVVWLKQNQHWMTL